MTGLNATVDFLLAATAAIEVWQSFFQELRQNQGVSFLSQLRRFSCSTRFRRALRTVAISSSLLLAGAASIVRAYVSKPIPGVQAMTDGRLAFQVK